MTPKAGTLLMYRPKDQGRSYQVQVNGRAKDGTLYVTRIARSRASRLDGGARSIRVKPADHWRLSK